MEIQLEFDFFDWKKYEASRAQAIVNNIPPEEPLLLTDLMRIKPEPQERYHDFIKRMLKNA
jgi:hypothetical protein